MWWLLPRAFGGIPPIPLTAGACLALWDPPPIHTFRAVKLNFAVTGRFLSQPWPANSCSVGSKLQILRKKPPMVSQSPLNPYWGWRRLRNPGFTALCQDRSQAEQEGYLPASDHQEIMINPFTSWINLHWAQDWIKDKIYYLPGFHNINFLLPTLAVNNFATVFSIIYWLNLIF